MFPSVGMSAVLLRAYAQDFLCNLFFVPRWSSSPSASAAACQKPQFHLDSSSAPWIWASHPTVYKHSFFNADRRW